MQIRTAAMLGIQILSAIGVSILSTESLRAEEGTAVQREACTPDVFRYCVMQIPNHDAIANCLQHNSWRLSKKCKLVMDGKLK
jgi:hypothetical protein